LRWLGVAYLLWFAWTSLKSAREAAGLQADTHQRSLKPVILTTLALTFLNPGVYLDTVVMLGNLANQQGPEGVGPFTIGAMLGSATWFLGIGCGARGLSRYLARPKVWQVLDLIIAAVLVILAVTLALTDAAASSAVPALARPHRRCGRVAGGGERSHRRRWLSRHWARRELVAFGYEIGDSVSERDHLSVSNASGGPVLGDNAPAPR